MILLVLPMVLMVTGQRAAAARTSLEFELADLVVIGDVSEVTSEVEASTELISSASRIEVHNVLKGTLTETSLLVESYGGTWQNTTQWALGSPRFRVGEEVLLYLSESDGHAWRPLSGDGMRSKVTLQGPASRSDDLTTATTAAKTGGQGYGFSTGKYWTSLPVTFYINEAGTPDYANEFSLVVDAFLNWEDIAASYIDFSYGGLTTRQPVADGYNVVGWVTSLPPELVGRTSCSYFFDSLTECDMQLNDNYLWGSGQADRYDIENVVTHEAGHFHYLDDLSGSEDEAETMYSFLSLGEIKRRTLEWGDEMGSRYIYRVAGGPFDVGDLNEGAGTDLAAVDSDTIYDIVTAWIENPSGVNRLRWRVGYDVSSFTGQAASWSVLREAPLALGYNTDGLGIAVTTSIDGDSRPDIFAVWINDFSSGSSTMRFAVGLDLQTDGSVLSWSSVYFIPGYVGSDSLGTGAAIASIGGTSRPDVVLFWLDVVGSTIIPYYKIGWDLDTAGRPASWSAERDAGFRPANVGFGAGLAIADLDSNAKRDLIFGYENGGIIQIRVGWDIDTSAYPVGWSREFVAGRAATTYRGGFGLGAIPLYLVDATHSNYSIAILVAGIVPAGWPDPGDNFEYRWS